MNILGSNLSYSFLVIGAWIGVVCTLAIVGYRFYGDKSKRNISIAEKSKAVINVINSPTEKLTSLHSDIIRLSRKTYIITQSGEQLPLVDDTIPAIKHLFENCFQQIYLKSKNESELIDQFKYSLSSIDSSIDPESYIKQILKNELLSHKVIVPILKSMTQEVVAPFIVPLKMMLYEVAPFKDVRGEWYIIIDYSNPSHVSVSHRKKEQSMYNEPSKSYTFEWSLKIQFKTDDFYLMDIDFFITNLEFGPQIEDSFKSSLSNLLVGYIR